jgi:3-oxoacyl-[acyl-carrier protein] reductase
MDLTNRVIAITGGAQGLGKAMAISLLESGARVVLLDINPEKLDQALLEFKTKGHEPLAIAVNVASETEVDNTFDKIIHECGRLDGLINNAGIIRDGLLVKTKDKEIVDRLSLESWQQVIDINLTGVFLCGRAAAEQMILQADGGVIINISSISRAGNIGQSNYAAAKAGVVALTTTWAKELAKHNIRCAAIAPGFIETDMTQSMRPEIVQKITSAIPLNRLGQANDVAQTVKFIFENDYLTGRVIELDGGLRV